MKCDTWTILGAGNFIYDVIDAIESNGQQIEYIVLNREINRNILDKIPSSVKIIGITNFVPTTDFYFFGFINPQKEPFLESLKQHKLTYPNLIHRFSYVSKTVEMGRGNFVGAGTVTAPNAKLGNFNFMNRGVSVGHDTIISDFNHLGPGCTVAGRCRIGNKNFLGAGSTLIENVEIKDQIIVGAGGVVTQNILEIGTYVGVPVTKLSNSDSLEELRLG